MGKIILLKLEKDFISKEVRNISQILKSSPREICHSDKEAIITSCDKIIFITNDAYIGEKIQIIREHIEKLYIERDYEKISGFMGKDFRLIIAVACSDLENILPSYKEN